MPFLLQVVPAKRYIRFTEPSAIDSNSVYEGGRGEWGVIARRLPASCRLSVIMGTHRNGISGINLRYARAETRLRLGAFSGIAKPTLPRSVYFPEYLYKSPLTRRTENIFALYRDRLKCWYVGW